MRPFLIAIVFAVLPLAAHADVVFSGDVSTANNSSYNPDFNGTFLDDPTGNYTLSFLLPPGSLVNYTGGPICTVGASCNDGDPIDDGTFASAIFFPDNSISEFTSGSLVEDFAATALLPGSEVQFDLIGGMLTAEGGASLSGPLTGSIIIDTGAGQFLTENFDFVSGQTTPVSATPEPSSLFLLGTGALSLAAAARRRLLRG